MQAVVQVGSTQYLVKPGQRISVDRMTTSSQEQVHLDRVLLVVTDDNSVHLGTPTLAHASVVAKVIDHLRGPKLRIGKFKAKSRYRKTTGFRSDLTQLEIVDIRVK
jgi:large subunit ribosomal protein L21